MNRMEGIERVFRIAWIMLRGAFLMWLFEHHWPAPDGWAGLFLGASLVVFAEAAYRRLVGLLERQNSLLQEIASALGQKP